MAAVAPIIRLLPAVLKLFPKFNQAPKLVKGQIIPVSDVTPIEETELARALKLKVKVTKKKDFNDGAHVIKVSDAIKCVEDNMSDGKFVAKATAQLLAIAQNVILGGGSGSERTVDFAQKMADCFREKALKQTAVRKRLTYRYSKRAI